MAIRPRHPAKEIEKVLKQAETLGWRIAKSPGKGHAWGRMYCPLNDRLGCIISIWSTPRNSGNHARQILSKVDSCPHSKPRGDHDQHEKDIEQILENQLRELETPKGNRKSDDRGGENHE